VANGGAGNDSLTGGAGADQLDGGSGTDTVSYDASLAGVSINLANNVNSGGDAAGDVLTDIENITGSHSGDAVSGDFSNNLIDGGDGDDTIASGGGGSDTMLGDAGNDTLTGGDGRDVLIGGAGADMLDGGNGIDTATYAASSAAISLNLATGVNTGGDAQGDTLANIEQIVGSAFADSITGDNHDLILDGGDGNDTISGGTGDDFLIGGQGDDILYGGAGGADALTGGAGRDVFAFRAINDSTTAAPDMIMDFVHSTDQIDLRGLGFTDIVNGAASGTHLGYSYDAASDFTSITSASGFKILLAGDVPISSLGDVLVGGAGDTLYGGAGADTFAFHAGFGNETLYSFAATGELHDTIQFDTSLFADWAHLLGATKQQGSDLLITFDAQDTLLLKGVSLANFTSVDARFV
jgi:Ca2+-binding RTX toxin-like protein